MIDKNLDFSSGENPVPTLCLTWCRTSSKSLHPFSVLFRL